jgi:hypothetical protein
MMQTDMRRDLAYFVFGAVPIALAATLLFQLAPWPTLPVSGQAALLGWGPTLGFLALGALGAALSSRIGAPSAPRLGDSEGWRRMLLWGLGAGLANAVFDLALTLFTPVGPHAQAVERAAGITWGNVALPYSLLHYAHAAVVTECILSLGLLVIPTWLVSTLLLKGRWQAQVFWTLAVAGSLVEPLSKSIGLKRLPLVGMSPMDVALTLEGIFWQLVFAALLRRYGWPAPMLMRYGYYLLFRITAGYFFPHSSDMYPGPH